MALVLNILLSIISVGIFSGRIYELMNLTDAKTNFLTFTGIVFNPYILPIFVIITICCGILILGDIKSSKNFHAKSAGIFSVFAGVSFLAYIVTALIDRAVAQNTSSSFVFLLSIMLGALGFIALGILGLHGKNYEIIITGLLTIFCIGLCLEVIVFNVSSIQNINFLKESLSSISVVIFLLLVFKNAYSPSSSSIMWLYISGFTCFVFCGVMYLADIAYGAAVYSISVSSLFLYSGYVFIGLYAVCTAILAIPNGKIEISIKSCEPSAWNSIKMLEQTQELQVKEKAVLSGIALREMEYKSHNDNMNKKTTMYNMSTKIAEVDEDVESEKGKKIKEKKEKIVKEKPIREKAVKEKPEKGEQKKSFKATENKKNNLDTKVVYKRPQD